MPRSSRRSSPQSRDLNQRCSNGMLAKENPRPGQIQRQLHQEQSKRPAAPRRGRRQAKPATPRRPSIHKAAFHTGLKHPVAVARLPGGASVRYHPLISLAVHRPPMPATAKHITNQKINANQRTVVLPSYHPDLVDSSPHRCTAEAPHRAQLRPPSHSTSRLQPSILKSWPHFCSFQGP